MKRSPSIQQNDVLNIHKYVNIFKIVKKLHSIPVTNSGEESKFEQGQVRIFTFYRFKKNIFSPCIHYSLITIIKVWSTER